MNKTKVMVFRPSGRKPNLNFHVGEHDLEMVTSYKYLGMTIGSSGSFTQGIRELAQKGRKAWYALRSGISIVELNNPCIFLKLFHSMVKPILTYGSEVWSQQYTFVNGLHIGDRCEFERVLNQVCKQILGVGKLTSNLASRSELGQQPLALDILKNTVRFWYKLENSDADSLLHNCLLSEKELSMHNTKSWYTVVKAVLVTTGRASSDLTFSKSELKSIYRSLATHIAAASVELINGNTTARAPRGGNKLRTYAKIATGQGVELYLTRKLTWHQKQALAKFRTGNHRLRIEVGRHTKPKLDVSQRICEHCNMNAVEDEMHFVLDCTRFSSTRDKYIFMYGDVEKNANFISLFTSNCEIRLRALADYLLEAMELRRTLT
jgi:hypothetical protein